MSPRFLVLLIISIIVCHASAEQRTWRDQETARAIVADLVAVKGDMIRLKLESGREVNVPLSRFHKDDQAYVRTWKKDVQKAAESGDARGGVAESAVRRAVRISATEQKGESKSTGSANNRKRTSSVKYQFRLDIARDAPKLRNVIVNYTVFKRIRTTDSKKDASSGTRVVRLRGNKKLGTLEPGASKTFFSAAYVTTDSTVETKQKSKGGNNKKGKGKAKSRSSVKRISEEIMGIHVEVSVNGASAVTVEQPSGLLRNVERYD